MGEIIMLGVGQAGCQINYQAVSQLAIESNILPDGTLTVVNGSMITPKSLRVHFEENSKG
jgi:hypothetical protein